MGSKSSKLNKYVRPCTRCKKKAVNKWSASGPVCKDCWLKLGCPQKPAPPPIPEPILDAGVPLQLASIRAAGVWSHKELPQHPVVQTWVAVRRKNPKEFMSTWERMEKEFAEVARKPVSAEAVVAVDSDDELDAIEDAASDRLEAELEAWLEKTRLAALETARKIERGEKA